MGLFFYNSHGQKQDLENFHAFREKALVRNLTSNDSSGYSDARYQRQTGRSMRQALAASRHIVDGKNVLILVSTLSQGDVIKKRVSCFVRQILTQNADERYHTVFTGEPRGTVTPAGVLKIVSTKQASVTRGISNDNTVLIVDNVIFDCVKNTNNIPSDIIIFLKKQNDILSNTHT